MKLCGSFFDHLVNQQPSEQLDVVLVAKDPGVDHLLELTDGQAIRDQSGAADRGAGTSGSGRNRHLVSFDIIGPRWYCRIGLGRNWSPPSSQELLDRIVDPFLVADLGKGQVFLVLEGLFELAIELARAVGALDLAVAEQVALGEKVVAQAG